MINVVFTGEYDHRVDERGRVAIPAPFRAEFAAGGYVMLGPDGQIQLHTNDGYQSAVDQQANNAGLTLQDRQRRRAIARALKFELDRQGRVTIPQRMREQAGLEGDVTLLGDLDHVEIWVRARWLEESALLDDGYSDLLEGLAKIIDAPAEDGAS